MFVFPLAKEKGHFVMVSQAQKKTIVRSEYIEDAYLFGGIQTQRISCHTLLGIHTLR